MDTGPEAALSLRERQKQQTRSHLLETSARLIGERGYQASTIEDIARAAGMSRATVYSYFPSKEAIVRGLVVELWDGAEALYVAFGRLTEWSRPTVRDWVQMVVETWERSGDRLRVGAARLVDYDDFYLDYHRRFVRALTADEKLWGRFPAEEAERRALWLISGLELFLNTWLVRGWAHDREAAIDTLTDVWRATLNAEEPAADGRARRGGGATTR
ncbi:TetR/AcrR family transcriptional regulator [Rhodococcus sp. NPDC127528]|uniref:TetR/AcrR family transcriptional regulator n=1 Tax=unclassified Rhodococcus (in: high G+C Gram-positive bacteria) TaxID=192944 RepID=UPI0036434F25